MSATEPCASRAVFPRTRWIVLTRPEDSPSAICFGTWRFTERYLFAENMQGNSSRYTRHDRDLAATLEDILALMQRLHAESIDIFSKLTDDNQRRHCGNVAGVDLPASQ